ncbi:unnamed protein product [Caenorhabditis angaria]|uniref:Protein KTI12 homolog n=1 Tax=Caenorhabditis angaria TaxID=860376 RepID=A0A9P1N110_9PELO|nr:unnamed protein product [Caenorhabditis angaria]
MPLILITGHPSSGKSTICQRLVEKFRENEKNLDVLVIRDEDFGTFSRNSYESAAKEKDVRSWIRGQIQQNLTKNRIVICDALNYIKGYRYELFLAAKMSKTTYCVVQVTPSLEICEWLNEQKPEEKLKYGPEQIGPIIQRYERPDTKFRWEKPLFEVKIGKAERKIEGDLDDMDMEIDLEHPAPKFADIFEDEIVDWVLNGTQLTENQSTQLVPLAPTNFLHELDRTTQEVITVLLAAQRTATRGQQITVPTGGTVTHLKARSLPEFTRFRHQFMTIAKKSPISDRKLISEMFCDFLNSNLR